MSILTKVSGFALLAAGLLSLAFAPNSQQRLPNQRYSSMLQSLVVQSEVLQEESEQLLLAWERSNKTTEVQNAVLELRKMQQINQTILQQLDYLFMTEDRPTGATYAPANMALIKTHSQQFRKHYLDWALEQTVHQEDPRYRALEAGLAIAPVEEDFEQGALGLLQARVWYSQIELAEQAAVHVFVQNKDQRAVYWPFEVLLLDWEQPPTYVGKKAKGRLLLGSMVPSVSPATVAGKALLAWGDGFYYETTPNTLGQHYFQVDFSVENALTGAAQRYSKTVHYTVIPQ